MTGGFWKTRVNSRISLRHQPVCYPTLCHELTHQSFIVLSFPKLFIPKISANYSNQKLRVQGILVEKFPLPNTTTIWGGILHPRLIVFLAGWNLPTSTLWGLERVDPFWAASGSSCLLFFPLFFEAVFSCGFLSLNGVFYPLPTEIIWFRSIYSQILNVLDGIFTYICFISMVKCRLIYQSHGSYGLYSY